jgi:hypothetical protein
MGDIVMIVHQTADMTKDAKTILSAGQLEIFGCKIFDKSPKISKSTPYIKLPGGYMVPITIRRGYHTSR